MATISRFVQLLEKKLPAGPGMFNPWRDYDRENEIGSEGPAIRVTFSSPRPLDTRAATLRVLP